MLTEKTTKISTSKLLSRLVSLMQQEDSKVESILNIDNELSSQLRTFYTDNGNSLREWNKLLRITPADRDEKNFEMLEFKQSVKKILSSLEQGYSTPTTLTSEQHEELKKVLLKSGLELLDDNKSILIEKIKNVITEMIHYSDDILRVNNSDYISKKLNYDYTYLANIFSEVNGITIQQYIIINKIERVKELLLYNQLNLTEIAFQLHYSSVAHLSNQFKKVTGIKFNISIFKV